MLEDLYAEKPEFLLSPYQLRDPVRFPVAYNMCYDFHARHQRFAIMVCHRRFGKTVMCINDMIDKAIQNELDMPRYAYIAPLYKQAKDVAWSYLKYYSAALCTKIMESELTVFLNNGARLSLYGADNPDSLRGVYYDGVVLDEFGDMAPRLFREVIRPTLVDRKGWAVFIGTPKGPNHFMELWEEVSDNADWFKAMLRASESGVIDAEELEALRNQPGADENVYRQEFECDFRAAIRGSYYGEMLNKLEAAGHMGSFPWDPEFPVITAWDIGYSDDTSIWFVQTNGREFKVIDFFTVSGMSADEVVDELEKKPYLYGDCALPHDAKNKSFQTGKSTMQLFRARGMNQLKLVARLSLQDGIQAVRATLPKIFFNTDNKDVKSVGLNALRMYQREWDDKTKRFKEAPKHDWSSNPADAMRMLACFLNPSAVKRNAGGSKEDKKKIEVKNNVLNLEALFKDRERSLAGSRKI
jgi:phage terminase large subunit